MPQPSRIPLTYRDIALAMMIVLVAFTLRVIVVFDRAHNDWAFDPLPAGADQAEYVRAAELYEAGSWPSGPFHWQPGVVYYFVAIRALVGTSLGVMRVATSFTGALTCGLVIGAGWLLTGRRIGGLLAGLLLAIYPVAIFWSTDLLIPGLASFLVALFLWLALWQKETLKLWRTVGLGVTIGLLMITRSNLALMALAWIVYLGLLAPGRRSFAAHLLAFGFAAALTVAPVTLWNLSSGNGRFQLVSDAGMDEVYRANNRDADGLRRSGSPAMDVADDYAAMLIADIVRDPLRFVELQAHKLGLYWSSHEPGNNLDFFLNGKLASPLLRTIPLDFRVLSALGLMGIPVLYCEARRQAIFMALINLLIFAGVMTLWIEGRLKQPAVVPLVLTAAYLLARVPDLVRDRRWPVVVAPAILLAAFFSFGDWAIDTLPRKHAIASLPTDVRKIDLEFDGKLRFRGWRPLPEWPAPLWGWSAYDKPYAVELFWELIEPTSEDYNFYVAYIYDGIRYAGLDGAIGAVSFQPHPTSEWHPGELYGEIVGFRLRSDEAIPTGRNGEIRLGVYKWDEQGKVVNIPIASREDNSDYVVLQPFAVVDLSQPDPPPDGMTPSTLVFGTDRGDRIALQGYSLPADGDPGETVTLSFYWQALDDIREDYSLFIHVMDENGQLAVQHDGPPRNGAFLTSTWPQVAPVRDDIAIRLPDRPGAYQVYIGLYHSRTHDRLPVDAPDYRPLLGEIVVGTEAND